MQWGAPFTAATAGRIGGSLILDGGSGSNTHGLNKAHVSYGH